MNLRRFGAPILTVLFCLCLVLARLWDVQVREHEVWAREAATLGRVQNVLPHMRGRILDRHNRVWVQDEVRYELEFVWRDFRRGHPLGQVAELRSLIWSDPVELDRAELDLVEWAELLVRLTPRDLTEFARGETIALGERSVPGIPPQDRRRLIREQRRPDRAAEASFYLQRLLDVTGREAKRLRELRSGRGADRSYLELVASLRRRPAAAGAELEPVAASSQRLRRELRDRIDRSLVRLAELAELVDWREIIEDLDEDKVVDPYPTLLALLESARRDAADSAADRLFETAAGFEPENLSSANLARLDLDWLAHCLAWNPARLAAWRDSRGQEWSEPYARLLAGYAYARAQVAAHRGRAEARRAPVDALLDALAYPFVRYDPGDSESQALMAPWERFRQLTVPARLVEVLADGERLAVPRILPIQHPPLRLERWEDSLTDEALLEAALGPLAELPAYAQLDPARSDNPSLVAALMALAARDAPEWQPGELEPIVTVLRDWDARLQMYVGGMLQPLGEAVPFAAGRLRGALEDRDHVVKDMDARARKLLDEPSIQLVHLVARRPAQYAGFRARPVSTRVPQAFSRQQDPDSPVLAAGLIGQVRMPQLVTLLDQGRRRGVLAELQGKLELEEGDREELLEIVGDSYHANQQVGSTGIEGYFDHELSGRNGYSEVLGLSEQADGGRTAIHREPIDGHDLVLTLDMDLQRAGEEVINQPAPAPSGDSKPDDEWSEHPVGAITLISVEGEVLCAASAPLDPDLPRREWRDGERQFNHDRTLRQPKFHPPGSIFKPLVAAYALEKLNLNPNEELVACSESWGPANRTGRGAGWRNVACWNSNGHTSHQDAIADRRTIALADALRVSCNTYFAFLGDTYYGDLSFFELWDYFGIREPTGVRHLDGTGDTLRDGLREDYKFRQPASRFLELDRQRLANGLVNVSTTPLQMARAYAGLATGVLPELRLVRYIGDGQVALGGAELPIRSEYLRLIRRDMRAVVEAEGGSAHNKGLSAADLGFSFLCKTGSADYRPGMVPPYGDGFVRGMEFTPMPGMRKHTWVAGWFPADEPKFVLIVYLHDTATTSSHGAVYVAAQFLNRPEVAALLLER